jgi:hypothetical protein
LEAGLQTADVLKQRREEESLRERVRGIDPTKPVGEQALEVGRETGDPGTFISAAKVAAAAEPAATTPVRGVQVTTETPTGESVTTFVDPTTGTEIKGATQFAVPKEKADAPVRGVPLQTTDATGNPVTIFVDPTTSQPVAKSKTFPIPEKSGEKDVRGVKVETFNTEGKPVTIIVNPTTGAVIGKGFERPERPISERADFVSVPSEEVDVFGRPLMVKKQVVPDPTDPRGFKLVDPKIEEEQFGPPAPPAENLQSEATQDFQKTDLAKEGAQLGEVETSGKFKGLWRVYNADRSKVISYFEFP